METNNVDKVFKEAFRDRKLQPSNSAWDRLSLKLAIEKKRKRKKQLLYLGYAASLLLLISFTYIYLSENNTVKEIPTQEVVKTNIPITNEQSKFNKIESGIKEEIKVANKEIKTPLINEPLTSNLKTKPSLTAATETKTPKQPILEIEEIFESKIDTTEIYIASIPSKSPATKSKRFKIDPLFLLNSIEKEATPIALDNSELLSKSDKLSIIKKELENKKLKISPEELLAEVEKNTEEKSFREKFLESLKNNISTLATAISKRNK